MSFAALGLFDMILALLGSGAGGYLGFVLTHRSILKKAVRVLHKRTSTPLTENEKFAATHFASPATSGSHVI